MRTSSLDLRLWIITIIIGSVTLLVGFLTRLCLPVDEDPNAYFDVALSAEERMIGVLSRQIKRVT